MRSRHHALDYLRGGMAVSVMLYHYYTWYTGDQGAHTIISKLGIYAVGVFYILSGLSLALAYTDKLTSLGDHIVYFVKRVFRIFPLFWMATSTHMLFQIINGMISEAAGFSIETYEVIINYLLIFGFFDPARYIAIGAWSIGNEMVFYAVFPVMILLLGVSRRVFLLGFLVSFSIFSYFSFIALDGRIPLSGQWSEYVNPLNQFFLFYAGVTIGVFLKSVVGLSWKWKLGTLGLLLLFCFVPGGDDQVILVTGFTRIILSAVAITLVACVYVSRFYLGGILGKILQFLGETSYSIYLLHPLVSFPVVFLFGRLGIDLLYGYVFSVFLTIACGGLTYHFFEKPGVLAGKRVASRIQVFFRDLPLSEKV